MKLSFNCFFFALLAIGLTSLFFFLYFSQEYIIKYADVKNTRLVSIDNSKCQFHDLIVKNKDDNLAMKYLSSARKSLKRWFNSCKINFNFQSVVSQEKNSIILNIDLLSNLTNTNKHYIKCRVKKSKDLIKKLMFLKKDSKLKF